MADNGDGDTGGLPTSIEAAWGERVRPSRGPRPGLSVSGIVGAAVGVAAGEGLGAVSMGRVAKELGVSTMSLYRYVASKEELYVLMQEVAFGELPGPPEPGTGWREGLTEWAHEMRGMFRRNLWVLRVPISGPPATPNSVAWWDLGMAALDGTGLDDGTRTSVVLLVSNFVRSDATVMADLEAGAAARGASPEDVTSGYGRALRRLVDPVRYPSVARLLESGIMSEPDNPDYEFLFGLDCLLDGVDALIRRRASGAPGR
ncbi:TetR/AcrR family transcriptional regulator [Streptomyces paludis]|uniref:TetR/AcrR family transcriptional regulator n=1 Tax=Streptomyces paludis TaxID=2282738 RepID=A0A345HRM0_9ACTN|nr:TetR/AcrR family transcriptional regulator [Streptomyces paludis]AXG79344.1 TetR/AcrR family transcriptional regulator [Streptomyces paludis]